MSLRPYWPLPGSLRAWVRKKPMEFLHAPTFMEKFGGGSNMIRGLEPGRHVTVSHKDVWKSCLPSQIQPCKETLFANWGPPCRVVVENISVYDESNGHSHRGEVETWQWKTNQWMKMYCLLNMMIFLFPTCWWTPQCTHILEGLKRMQICNKIYGHFGGGSLLVESRGCRKERFGATPRFQSTS